MKATLEIRTHDVQIHGRNYGAGFAWPTLITPGRRFTPRFAAVRAGGQFFLGPINSCYQWLEDRGMLPSEARDLLVMCQDRVRSDLMGELHPEWN